MKHYNFRVRFSIDLDADTEEQALKAAEKIFATWCAPWGNKKNWKDQLRGKNIDVTKDVTVYI